MMGRPTRTSMADLYTIKEIFKYNEYGDLLSILEGKPVKVVDVGANIGSFTIWLNNIVGVSSAYCFEPETDTYKLLQFNLTQNNCDSAIPVHAALGGHARKIKILLKKDSPGGTSIYGSEISPNSTADFHDVHCHSFEEWVASVEGIFDILKLDCEGSEWEIVRGSNLDVFKRFRILIAEVHDDPSGIQQVSEFKNMMESLGYRTIRWDNRPMGIYLGVR